MTCKCGSNRIAHIGGKCSDLSNASIPHLGLEHDGYVIDVGVGSGDYIELTFCLDCGQIQNFTPTSDEEILAMEEFEGQVEEAEEDAEYCDNEPDVFTLKHVEKQRITKLMQDAFGGFWRDHNDARETLRDELNSPATSYATKEAIKELLA